MSVPHHLVSGRSQFWENLTDTAHVLRKSDTVNSEIFARIFFSETSHMRNTREMAKLYCHLLMKVNHIIVKYFYSANMSFNAIREN